MRIKWWTGADYTQEDIPDDLLRPLVEAMLVARAWDRNLERLGRMVNDTRLNITDHLLQRAQRAEAVEADAIVDAAEQTAEASAVPDRAAKARAALAAKRAAKLAGVATDG